MARLIDADALRQRMYHEAFETDTELQKWDSGCWIRYKLFENCIDEQPTISPDEVRGVVHCKECTNTERDGTDDPAIYCKIWDRWEMPEDGFCYKGARMKGAGE